MEQNQLTEILAYLDQLLHGVKTGKLQWMEGNSTAYVWENKEKGGRIVLQRIQAYTTVNDLGKLTMGNMYSMKVLTLEGRPQFALSGATQKDVNAKMHDLFLAIETANMQKGINFLSSLLRES
jgi:hypothetical protein